MACCLEAAGIRTFKGKAGSAVTVKLKSAEGGAEIVHIRYAGTALDEEPPFEFVIQAGTQNLVVLFEASKPMPVELVEACEGGAEQQLDAFDFDPTRPARVYSVVGA